MNRTYQYNMYTNVGTTCVCLHTTNMFVQFFVFKHLAVFYLGIVLVTYKLIINNDTKMYLHYLKAMNKLKM